MTTSRNPQPVFHDDLPVTVEPVTFVLELPAHHQLFNCYELGFKGPHSMVAQYVPELHEYFSPTLELVAVVRNNDPDNSTFQPLNTLTVRLKTSQTLRLVDEIAAARNWLIAIDQRAPGDLAPSRTASI